MLPTVLVHSIHWHCADVYLQVLIQFSMLVCYGTITTARIAIAAAVKAATVILLRKACQG